MMANGPWVPNATRAHHSATTTPIAVPTIIGDAATVATPRSSEVGTLGIAVAMGAREANNESRMPLRAGRGSSAVAGAR